ncbi:BMP family ABC transporter substrate-binding protein [Inquilinus sp. YAF38]|uniref:BMP family ABC transporter substrate-binding protein n=1 Tax=Inquilinus sp. YAF38 TaxID=3233084 RepID=UPI003F92DB05
MGTIMRKFGRHLIGSIAAAAVALALGAALPAQAAGGKLVFISPDPLGVNDFLKLGRKGAEAAAAAIGGEAKVYESTDPATRRQNVEAAAREGAAVVIVIGFEFGDIVPDAAAKFPDIKFLIVDQCIQKPMPNVYCAVFREHEGAYLAGAEAALTSESGTIGSVGALDIPFLHRFTDGFAAGAKAVNDEIVVSPTVWVGGDHPFSDPVRAQQQAVSLISEGADRVLAATSGGNGGIFKAAEATPGTLVFGVDVNQCPLAPGAVMDNIEKKVDVALVEAVKGILAGTQAPLTSYGVKEGGITLTGLGDDVAGSKCLIAEHPDVITKVKELRDAIAAGTVTVTDPLTAGQ